MFYSVYIVEHDEQFSTTISDRGDAICPPVPMETTGMVVLFAVIK